MQSEVTRILTNIAILLKSGLFRGQHCSAVPEAIQLVEAMIADASAKSEAQDVKA